MACVCSTFFGGVREELGRAVGHGGGRVHHRGQRLPVDGHRGGAVGRGLGGGSDDGGDRLAGMAHAVHRERIVLPPDLALRLAAALDGDDRDGERRHVGHEVAPGHDGDHAGQRARRGGVDAANIGVGVGAAHEGDVQEAGQRDVGDVLRRARDQARVFLALDLSSKKLGCHGGFVLLGQMIRQNAAACARLTAPGRVACRRSPEVTSLDRRQRARRRMPCAHRSPAPRRSRLTLQGLERTSHRTFMRALDLDEAAMAKPFVGVMSTARQGLYVTYDPPSEDDVHGRGKYASIPWRGRSLWQRVTHSRSSSG